MHKTLPIFVVAALLLTLSGCTYFKVTDVSSGKEYITNNWLIGESAFTGTTRFTDLKSGKEVTLQAYEKQIIPSDEAKAQIDTQKN